jgi:hypothetical protein
LISPTEPFIRLPGRCSCGDRGVVRYGGQLWCGFCALFTVGDHPVDDLERWTSSGPGVGYPAVTGSAHLMRSIEPGEPVRRGHLELIAGGRAR